LPKQLRESKTKYDFNFTTDLSKNKERNRLGSTIVFTKNKLSLIKQPNNRNVSGVPIDLVLDMRHKRIVTKQSISGMINIKGQRELSSPSHANNQNSVDFPKCNSSRESAKGKEDRMEKINILDRLKYFNSSSNFEGSLGNTKKSMNFGEMNHAGEFE